MLRYQHSNKSTQALILYHVIHGGYYTLILFNSSLNDEILDLVSHIESLSSQVLSGQGQEVKFSVRTM